MERCNLVDECHLLATSYLSSELLQGGRGGVYDTRNVLISRSALYMLPSGSSPLITKHYLSNYSSVQF